MANLIRNVAIGIVVLIIAVTIAGFFLNKSAGRANLGPLGSAHWHVDFLVMLNGGEINFNQQKYFVRSPFVHVEPDGVGGAGKVIHVHATGVPVGMFFESLNMRFTKDCFRLDSGREYCTEGTKQMRMYVNGEPNEEYDAYVMKNLDRILISYGDYSEQELQHQLDLVPDIAKRE